MKKNYLIIVLLALLVGCGGSSSGGDPVSNESAAGIWEGTGETDKAISGNIVGMIASNGKAFFLTDAMILVYGDASVSGNSISINGALYGDVSPSVTMSGTVQSGVSINVNYSTSDENGAISLAKADSSIGVYNRTSSFSKLMGTWDDDFTDDAGTWTFTILNSGEFSAIRDPDGCSISGQFQTIDSTKNEYALTASVSSCADLNGNYSGLAFTSDDGATDNVISIVIVNSENAGVFEAIKRE